MTDITQDEITAALEVWLDDTASSKQRDQMLMEAIKARPEITMLAMGITEHFVAMCGPVQTTEKLATFCEVVFATGISYGLDAGRRLYESRELQRMFEGRPLPETPETVSVRPRGFWNRLFRRQPTEKAGSTPARWPRSGD